jgi:hypothetical protein
MSWKLVFGLSLFGLAMGFATVFVVRPDIEPFVWGGIFLVCAVLIAKRAPSKYFLHGLCVGLLNGVWVTAAHVGLFSRYVAAHGPETTLLARYGAVKTMMAISGPVAGLASGIVLGFLAWILSKFLVSSHSEYAGW